ncbi:polysaccharide biosynthesis/export family protein [Vibrio lentus]|nr:polysaccharide biosynthesis/export family protein [Vibrio lentus]
MRIFRTDHSGLALTVAVPKRVTGVHADGTIFYPYIGTVEVAGKTVREVRTDITKPLSFAVRSKRKLMLTLRLSALRKPILLVRSQRPGRQAITNIPLTLLDAVNRSGGVCL